VERILTRPAYPKLISTSAEFSSWLGIQSAVFVQFVHNTIFHGAYPNITATEERPFLFAGLPMKRATGEPYHSWLSANDHAELFELINTGGVAYRPLDDEDGVPTKFGEGPEWFIPGLGGLLPPALLAMLDGTIANVPPGPHRPFNTAAPDVGAP